MTVRPSQLKSGEPDAETRRRLEGAQRAGRLDTLLNSFVGVMLIGMLIAGSASVDPHDVRGTLVCAIRLAGPATGVTRDAPSGAFDLWYREEVEINGRPASEYGDVSSGFEPLGHGGVSALAAWPSARVTTIHADGVSPPVRIVYRLVPREPIGTGAAVGGFESNEWSRAAAVASDVVIGLAGSIVHPELETLLATLSEPWTIDASYNGGGKVPHVVEIEFVVAPDAKDLAKLKVKGLQEPLRSVGSRQ